MYNKHRGRTTCLFLLHSQKTNTTEDINVNRPSNLTVIGCFPSQYTEDIAIELAKLCPDKQITAVNTHKSGFWQIADYLIDGERPEDIDFIFKMGCTAKDRTPFASDVTAECIKDMYERTFYDDMYYDSM